MWHNTYSFRSFNQIPKEIIQITSEKQVDVSVHQLNLSAKKDSSPPTVELHTVQTQESFCMFKIEFEV